MDEVKLLPCPNPWCERVLPPQAIRYTGGTPQTYPWSVRCTDCHLRGPSCKTEAEAIALWNAATRPPIVTDEVVGPSLGASADADRATHERGQSSVSPPAVGIPSAELHAAFMAGWLTGHHGNEPVDAWPVYLASLGGSAK